MLEVRIALPFLGTNFKSVIIYIQRKETYFIQMNSLPLPTAILSRLFETQNNSTGQLINKRILNELLDRWHYVASGLLCDNPRKEFSQERVNCSVRAVKDFLYPASCPSEMDVDNDIATIMKEPNCCSAASGPSKFVFQSKALVTRGWSLTTTIYSMAKWSFKFVTYFAYPAIGLFFLQNVPFKRGELQAQLILDCNCVARAAFLRIC